MKKRATMTFRQIGGELGITPSSASSIYYRAIRKLHRQCPNALAYLRMLASDAQECRLATKEAL